MGHKGTHTLTVRRLLVATRRSPFVSWKQCQSQTSVALVSRGAGGTPAGARIKTRERSGRFMVAYPDIGSSQRRGDHHAVRRLGSSSIPLTTTTRCRIPTAQCQQRQEHDGYSQQRPPETSIQPRHHSTVEGCVTSSTSITRPSAALIGRYGQPAVRLPNHWRPEQPDARRRLFRHGRSSAMRAGGCGRSTAGCWFATRR